MVEDAQSSPFSVISKGVSSIEVRWVKKYSNDYEITIFLTCQNFRLLICLHSRLKFLICDFLKISRFRMYALLPTYDQ